MIKYSKFLEDIYDGEELIWKKDEEYLVTYENDDNYYFGFPLSRGITKQVENLRYKIINEIKED
jgi:hypothetical protein